MRWMVILAVGALLAGCQSGVTETGYEPRKLGMSDAARRGLYAPKYSPESAAAEAEREAEMKSRRPSGGFSF